MTRAPSHHKPGPGYPTITTSGSARPLCESEDLELFWPAPRSYTSGSPTNRNRILHAKAICRACPLREGCLRWALDNDEREGIWGGTTPKERELIKKSGRQEWFLAAIRRQADLAGVA